MDAALSFEPLDLLAVFLAAVSTMVVGTVWYLPGVFGRRWMGLTGVDPNKPGNPGLVYGLSFVASLFTAVVLIIMSRFVADALSLAPIAAALITAFALWLGFTAARILVHDLFEGRSLRVFAINAGHELVTALVMGAVLGAFSL